MNSAPVQHVTLANRTIPGMTVGPLTEERDPVFLWVHTGRATVEAAGRIHVLTANQAIWVPRGVEHCTQTEPGAVVFPLFPPQLDGHGALTEVHVVDIPPAWSDWLVHQWDDNWHTSDVIPGVEALLDLLAATSAPVAGTAGDAAGPALPRSREALGVARRLLGDPRCPRSLVSFAALENVGVKTLQRQFLVETGMAFSEWRTRARIAAAATLLAAGGDVGGVRVRVGYATAAGFTKAFQRHTGLAPRDYGRRHSDPSRPVPVVSAVLAEHTGALVAGERPEPPSIPQRSFWALVNDFHVLMWVYRGTVQLHIGTRGWHLEQGQAIWVPAGIVHTIEFDEGSLMMSLARHHGRTRVSAVDLIVFSFRPEDESFLLHSLVADYSLFRPESGQHLLANALFRAQLAAAHDDETTGAIADIAQALRRDPADSRSLADWAARLRTTPARLGREFLAQTGQPFPRWRSQLRMDVARSLLWIGDHPGEVAAHLGYASPAAFAKVFTAAHGISPRDYRIRETQRMDA